jgi:hypothetical protein
MDWHAAGATSGGSSSASSSSKQRANKPPPPLSKHHKEVSARHPDIIKLGNRAVHSVGSVKLNSLQQARELIQEGTPPTLGTGRGTGRGDSTKYKESVILLRHLSPNSEGFVQDTQKHLGHLRDHPHGGHMIPGAEHIVEGVAEAHSWTLNHPHEATEDKEYLMGMSEEVRNSKLATIKAEEERVKARMAKHLT